MRVLGFRFRILFLNLVKCFFDMSHTVPLFYPQISRFSKPTHFLTGRTLTRGTMLDRVSDEYVTSSKAKTKCARV